MQAISPIAAKPAPPGARRPHGQAIAVDCCPAAAACTAAAICAALAACVGEMLPRLFRSRRAGGTAAREQGEDADAAEIGRNSGTPAAKRSKDCHSQRPEMNIVKPLRPAPADSLARGVHAFSLASAPSAQRYADVVTPTFTIC